MRLIKIFIGLTFPRLFHLHHSQRSESIDLPCFNVAPSHLYGVVPSSADHLTNEVYSFDDHFLYTMLMLDSSDCPVIVICFSWTINPEKSFLFQKGIKPKESLILITLRITEICPIFVVIVKSLVLHCGQHTLKYAFVLLLA